MSVRLKLYCCEDPSLIENYDKAKADNFVGWDLHHRLETHFSDGSPRLPSSHLLMKELVTLDMYYNRPASELIFMTKSSHWKLHSTGKPKSEATCQLLRNARLGKRHSEESKLKMSISKTGISHGPHTEETKRKISKSHMGKNKWSKGRHWFNNGITSVMEYKCPDGFIPGRLSFRKSTSNKQ